MHRRKAILAALLPLALVAAKPSATLPDITARTAQGPELHLDAAQHKVAIVHFWATWCAPCRVEMPVLDAAWRHYREQGLAMIGVALDMGASREKIASHAMDVTFPLARADDTGLKRSELPPALPETRIYGRDGRLRYVFRGGKPALDAAALDAILPKLLAER